MNNEIKKIVCGVIALCLLLILLDWAVGTVSEKMYYSSKYGIFHRQIYCINESNEDIMILGSSRAAHHYVPQIFIDSLGMSCYNAGSDGMCIYYHYSILSARIERGDIPKLVLLEVMPTDAEVSLGATFSLDAALERLAPHYGEVADIDTLFALDGWKRGLKLKSKTYRYNSKLVQTVKCNYISSPEDRGYEALIGAMNEVETNDTLSANSVNQVNIEDTKLKYVQKFIDMCKQHDIQLIMCYSPRYHRAPFKGVELIKELALKANVPFLDYGTDKQFQCAGFFKDESHLNDDGAHAYTMAVVESIKKYIM